MTVFDPNNPPVGAVGWVERKDGMRPSRWVREIAREFDHDPRDLRVIEMDGRQSYMSSELWTFRTVQGTPLNPFAEHGAALEALGKAMQDGNTTVARLVELADAAGLRLAFRVDGE